MTCSQLWTKTLTSISRKICCVKSAFQILYAVEQFSLLFSNKKLEQGAHLHQIHDQPSPRMSWKNCHAVHSHSSHMCCVELALKRLATAGKGLFYRSLPCSLTDGYAMLLSPSKGETAAHGCHCPRDKAVHIREVMARPWVGVCVPLALIYW